MAPENENYLNEINELKQKEREQENVEMESEKIGEIFGMGGRGEKSGYKYMIEREFEKSLINFISEYIEPEPFFKKLTGGSGYKVPNLSLLESGVVLVMQNRIEVEDQPIKKEFFEILDTGLFEDSRTLVQMVSMKEGDLEGIFDYKFEKLISLYPEYFAIEYMGEYSNVLLSPYDKFGLLMDMPSKEKNSFLKDANSIYYFVISLEINKKSHPALKAVLDTLVDIEERKNNQRKGNIETLLKKS